MRILTNYRSYERGVSFDTFDNRDAADFTLTLNYKHRGYQCTRRSRTFLCGTDQNDYSEFALEWLLDDLVDDGDEIVCLQAVEKDSRMASDVGIEEGKYRKEAERLLEQVVQKNSQDEKAISLVLELAVGKVEEIIQRMVNNQSLSEFHRLGLTAHRFVYTSPLCLWLGPVAATLKVYTACCPVLSLNTACSNRLFLLLLSDHHPSVRRKRRSVAQTRPDEATTTSWR